MCKMNVKENAVSLANSKNIHSSNLSDPKDFPALKNTHSNHSLKKEKIVNKGNGKATKSYNSLFSFYNNSENFKNIVYPKLVCSKIKNYSKSDAVNVEKKQEYSFQNFAGEKNEAVSEKQSPTLWTENEKKQLDSNKKVISQQRKNPNKKKRSEPTFFNLGEIVELNLSQKKIRQPKKLKNKFQRSTKKEVIGGNYLDSSNPQRKRGKYREIKKKKHTNLKLAIIKERIIKQKLKEENISDFCDENCVKLIDSINFKVEIEKYLNNLKGERHKKTKTKNAETNKNFNSVTKTLETLNLNSENNNMKYNHESIEAETEKNSKELTESKKIDKCSAVIPLNKTLNFTSKFREYCDNIITPSLNTAVSELIKGLVDLQDRIFVRDPIKAKAKKRHVSGFREVKKYLSMKKVKMIVLAPNLEKLKMEGSVYDIINELKTLCVSQNVPCVFALDRYKLGRCTKKNVPVSAFAVLNYEGLEDRFQTVIKNLEDAKKEFRDKMDKKINDFENVNIPLVSSLISVFKETKKTLDEAPSIVNGT